MATLKVWVDGAWEDALGGYLPTSGGMMDSGAVISFPNEADKTKVLLYGTEAQGFGIGITSGSLTMYGSSTLRFRQNTLLGTELFAADAAGIHPRTSIAGAMQNGWTGSVNFTCNPAVITADIDVNMPTTQAQGSYAYKFSNIPSGASGPRATITMHTKGMNTNYGVGGDIWVEARSDGIYAIFPGTGWYNAPFRIYATMTWAR